jgi:plastocyanin
MTLFTRRKNLCATVCALLPMLASTPAEAATHVVVIDKMQYGELPEFHSGDLVEFVNHDMFRHTVTAANGRFDLDLPPGKNGWLRINSAGTATFYCKYHPGMRGLMRAK